MSSPISSGGRPKKLNLYTDVHDGSSISRAISRKIFIQNQNGLASKEYICPAVLPP